MWQLNALALPLLFPYYPPSFFQNITNHATYPPLSLGYLPQRYIENRLLDISKYLYFLYNFWRMRQPVASPNNHTYFKVNDMKFFKGILLDA